MPDLVIEDGNFIAHYDELCIACKKFESKECPLLSVLLTLKLVTVSGMKVWRCKGYAPDRASPHFIERGDPIDAAQIKELAQKIEGIWRK